MNKLIEKIKEFDNAFGTTRLTIYSDESGNVSVYNSTEYVKVFSFDNLGEFLSADAVNVALINRWVRASEL